MRKLNLKEFCKVAVFMVLVVFLSSSCKKNDPINPVTLTNTITLSSAAGTNSQTNFINTAITTITYTTTGATGITFSGLPAAVSGAWSGNVVTISGTPIAAGIFNYTVTLLGGSGNVNATGTITVAPLNTVGAGSATPTLVINTALTSITHATTGATGIGVATGLPTGVIAAWSANVITISGTPTASGIFNYSIPLTGGYGNINATGTITVTPFVEPVNTDYVGTWMVIAPFTTDYGDISLKKIITFTDRSVAQLGQLQILSNTWMNYVSMKGSLSVNGNLMTVSITELGMSSSNSLGIPTGDIISYQSGSAEFDKLLSDTGQPGTFSSQYSVLGNQLTLKTDANFDGDYLDANEITVYTKQ